MDIDTAYCVDRGGPVQERAALTRQVLINAAADVFAQRGYAAATMTEILEAAGLTKGALYFHFRSKEDLARAIFAEDLRFSEVPAASIGGPMQDLINLSHAFAAALQTNPVARASVRLAVEMTFTPGEEPTGYDTWLQSAAALLEDARRTGQLAEGVEPASAAQVVVGSFTGLQLLSEATSHRAHLQRTLTDWWRLLIPGLTTAAAADVLVPEGSGGQSAEPAPDPETNELPAGQPAGHAY